MLVYLVLVAAGILAICSARSFYTHFVHWEQCCDALEGLRYEASPRRIHIDLYRDLVEDEQFESQSAGFCLILTILNVAVGCFMAMLLWL